MNRDIADWVINLWQEDTDFLIESSETLPKLDLQNDKRFQYNQGSTKDCTLYSAFGALSDLMDYELTKEDIKEIVDLSYEMWRREGEWRYIQSWVKCVCKWWNKKHPENPVAYYRVDLKDKNLVTDIISKNYTLCGWYRWNYSYNYDYVVDDILNWVKFGTPTYWHAVSVILRDWKKCIKDNYYPRKNSKGVDTNIYEVEPEFSALIDNWVYYSNAYLIVKVNNSERIAELKRLTEFRKDVEEAIALNSKMWRETNSEEFKDELHNTNNKLRAKLEDISREMNKFSL